MTPPIPRRALEEGRREKRDGQVREGHGRMPVRVAHDGRRPGAGSGARGGRIDHGTVETVGSMPDRTVPRALDGPREGAGEAR